MRVAGRIAAHLPADSGVTNVVHRGVLAASVPQLRGRRDEPSRAIDRALRTTVLGRFSPAEREWIEGIEARRLRMAAEFTVPGEEGPTAPNGRPDRWAPPFRWSMPRIWARFLMRLVGELGPESCLEMGTGFGISALYQASALEIRGAGKFTTLDQEPSLMKIAHRGFAELGLEHRIELKPGAIGQTLPAAAAVAAPIDYALIDAEHTEAATVENFDSLSPHLAPGAVVVVDDIFMDEEMRRAWETIKARPCSELTLTMRRLGIVVARGPG